MDNMSARLLCKLCKDIITAKKAHSMSYCRCGKLGIDDMGHGMCRIQGIRDDYAQIDDEGNEIIYKEDKKPEPVLEPKMEQEAPQVSSKEMFSELMLALTHQIEAMESLSQAGRFSPCTNQDLLAHQMWLHGMMKVLNRRLEEVESSMGWLIEVSDSKAIAEFLESQKKTLSKH